MNPAYVVSQAEVDDVVRRVRALVTRFGGQNDVLKTLRTLYSMYANRVEHATHALLLDEIERLENTP